MDCVSGLGAGCAVLCTNIEQTLQCHNAHDRQVLLWYLPEPLASVEVDGAHLSNAPFVSWFGRTDGVAGFSLHRTSDDPIWKEVYATAEGCHAGASDCVDSAERGLNHKSETWGTPVPISTVT